MKKSIVAAAVAAAAGMSAAAASEVLAAEESKVVTEGDLTVVNETSPNPVLSDGDESTGDPDTNKAADHEEEAGSIQKPYVPEETVKTQEDSEAGDEKQDAGVEQPAKVTAPEQTLVGQIRTEQNKTLNVSEEEPEITDGWHLDGDDSYYYSEGKKVTGVQEIEGKLYYFGQDGKLTYGQSWFKDKSGNSQSVCSDLSTGILFTGLFDLTSEYTDGELGTAYFSDNGLMHFGALNLNSNNYFFDLTNGLMYKNRFSNDGDYYFGKDGAMVYGQQNIEGNWYCFDRQDGKMKTGLTYLDQSYQSGQSKTVYYRTEGDKRGSMAYGLQNIEDRIYYFDSFDGHMLSSTLQKVTAADGRESQIYLGKDGAAVVGEANTGNEQWRYFGKDALMVTGFVQLTKAGDKTDMDKTVYYGADGIMVTGQKNIDGKWYCFDLYNGAMFTGFHYLDKRYQPDDPKTVYYNRDGVLQYGYQHIDGDLYCFGPENGSGAVVVNTLMDYQVGGKAGKVYFGADGKAARGQAYTGNGQWRYFDKTTCLMVTGFKELTKTGDQSDVDKFVYYDENGIMVTGQRNINGSWYCFDLYNGAMFTGRHELDTRYQPNGAKAVFYSTAATLEEGRGKLLTGEILDNANNKIYYADTFNGALQDDYAKELNGRLYFYNTYGDQKKNAQVHYNDAWYYVGEDGQFVKSELVNLSAAQNAGGAKTVYYGSDGKMVYGFSNVAGGWRYFSPATGAMQKDRFVDLQASQTPDHRSRISYFDQNGIMKTGNFTRNNAYILVNSDGTVTGCRINNVNYLSQVDPRWAYSMVGDWNMANSGCVPTSLTMIVNALNNTSISPYDLAMEIHRLGYMNTWAGGTGGDVNEYIPQRFNLTATSVTSIELMVKMLKMGAMISAAMNPGIFTIPGYTHQIVIFGYENGRAMVYDPYTSSNNGYYSIETLWSQKSTDRGDKYNGTPFTAYMKM